MKKIQRSLIYAILLCLGIVGTVQAEESVKIDFALVQDASGEAANKTAACIVVWVADFDEEKVFCGYGITEEGKLTKRDDDGVNSISPLRSAGSLTKVKKTIESWLAHIFSIKKDKLSESQKKIAQLFEEFVKQGVHQYKYDAALFKHTQPYDLVLPRQTIDVDDLSDRMFAFFAHNEVHRAVNNNENKQDDKQNTGGSSEEKPELVKWVETLDKNSAIYELLTNETSKAVLEEYAEILQRSDITEKLDNIDAKKTQTFTAISTNQIIMVILAIIIGVLLLIVVIFWTSGGSQDKMQNIIELNKIASDTLSRQIKAVTLTSSQNKSPIDTETNKQLIAIKRDIFNLLKTEKEKVDTERQDLKQQAATSEIRKKQAEIKLATTEEELTETKSELVEVKTRQERMHKSLESLMLKRFRVIKPAEISIDELLVKLTKQGGTWQWYQQVLSSQYEACKKAMKEVQALNNPQYDKILNLLNIDKILLHSREFITDNLFFETDEKLLGRMQAINGGTWLSKVLRADDLFKTYFSDIKELKPLANRIAVTAMMLEAALEEMGVEVIKPELLQKPSGKLPESAYKSASNRLLMELTHDKVISKLSDKEPKLVVDIDKYGFATQDNPNPSMTILYADLAGWEG